ncbi:DUF6646 family protein [Flavobacterium oreochromis]|uniref:Outer membrane protein beta-barrel domain-containing protein n=2 Tax=Flavobacterium TaxID=237 RepID=A0A246GBM2_9FLAO|nr:DUF6646 family protein [Flavobacterium oreochromis]OWP77215.1 hypothetical protein BWG23_05505 [Flavobacterium oreochromis]OWP78095.1 hypothetical protein BWK62_05695 [Flavobacterium oreochromis]POR22126.1 hypothetical protein BWK58_11400 [Flavobacterium columnare]QYS87440.1 hypothetical protein JJC03_06060 [Flavobacterium oreochromis]
MKKVFVLVATLIGFMSQAQEAYKGKGDTKFHVGANLQSGGTGLNVGTDFGLGENISVGVVANYLLDVKPIEGDSYDFLDRADLKARFNANIGKVLTLPEQLDVYPGLDLGLRNFGGHLGARYFFSEGFGLQVETGVPFAKYTKDPVGFDRLNNQFYVNLSAVFNL